MRYSCRYFAVTAVLGAVAANCQTPAAKVWQRATVTDISEERVYAGSSNAPDYGNVGTGTTARYRHIWTYTIDAGSTVYVIRGDCGKIFDSPCRLVVNGPVQISVGKPSGLSIATHFGMRPRFR